MIELKCRKCATLIGERENDTIKFGGIVVSAPAEVLCARCGTINTFPAAPSINPTPKPLEVIVVDDKKEK